MNIGFVTCVELGLSCMRAIYEYHGSLSLAITLLDEMAINKSGRVFIDEFCANHSIPLIKTNHINNPKVIEAIQTANLDWLFIIGWSQIANDHVIRSPRKGTLGMHPTLLPEGRGRAAIPWAIIKNLSRTGVTLFKMDSGVDTGPIIEQIEIPLNNLSTATELYQMVNAAHIQAIKIVMPKLLTDEIDYSLQDETKATVWPGRRPEDGLISQNGSVHDADRLVRATTKPYPGAYYLKDGLYYTVWRARIASETDVNLSQHTCLNFPDGVLIIEEFSERLNS